MTTKPAPGSAAASKNITKRIEELGDWRGETLARVRQLIHEADPEVVEEMEVEESVFPGNACLVSRWGASARANRTSRSSS